MHYLSQNGTTQYIKDSSTSAPRDDFEVWLFTLSVELDRVRHIREGGGLNIVVEDFKSLTDFSIWVQANLL